MPDTLQRLAGINPSPVSPAAAQSPAAQAVLERIVAQPRTTHAPGRLTRLLQARRAMATAIAAVVLGGSGAIAAADPFGWWSSDRNTARFAVAFQSTTTTPSAPRLICSDSGSGLACAPSAPTGSAYSRMGTVQPTPAPLTAAVLRGEIAQQVKSGQLSAEAAAAAMAVINTTPAAAFAQVRQALAFGSLTAGVIGAGSTVIVPPGNVPEFLACGVDNSALACRDLNGDTSVPVGAAIYRADPTPAWRAAPAVPSSTPSPAGLHLSGASSRLLHVLLTLATPQP